MSRNIAKLESRRSLSRWRKLPVSRRNRKTVPSGKTRPINPLVRTLSAIVAAMPQHSGDQNARKDERPKSGGEGHRGVKAAFVAIKPPAYAVDHQQQRQHAERNRQSRRPLTHAEHFEACGHAPVHERSFFQVAKAV